MKLYGKDVRITSDGGETIHFSVQFEGTQFYISKYVYYTLVSLALNEDYSINEALLPENLRLGAIQELKEVIARAAQGYEAALLRHRLKQEEQKTTIAQWVLKNCKE